MLGWRSCKNTLLPPMWLEFDSRTPRHKFAEFDIGSCPWKGSSHVTTVLLSPQKPTFPKKQGTNRSLNERGILCQRVVCEESTSCAGRLA